MLLTFFVFDRKWPFWANLVQNLKTVSLRWNLIPRLIQIYRIQWRYSLFLFLTGNAVFWQIWSKKSKLSVQAELWYLNFWCRWVRVGAVGFIHQSAVTNSKHLQSTYTPHLQYLQSQAHLESTRTCAVKLFCRNSQRVKPVGYFCRRAPSCISDRMFDRILNATLTNNLW